MHPYIPKSKTSFRPGCPCCKSKFMDGHNSRSKSTKRAHRYGRKAARREIKKEIYEHM